MAVFAHALEWSDSILTVSIVMTGISSDLTGHVYVLYRFVQDLASPSLHSSMSSQLPTPRPLNPSPHGNKPRHSPTIRAITATIPISTGIRLFFLGVFQMAISNEFAALSRLWSSHSPEVPKNLLLKLSQAGHHRPPHRQSSYFFGLIFSNSKFEPSVYSLWFWQRAPPWFERMLGSSLHRRFHG